MNSCEIDDREGRYRNTHRPWFQSPGFGKDCEIIEGILEMKNLIPKVVFHTYQRILIDLV